MYFLNPHTSKRRCRYPGASRLNSLQRNHPSTQGVKNVVALHWEAGVETCRGLTDPSQPEALTQLAVNIVFQSPHADLSPFLRSRPQVLGTDVSPDDALSVARFYEGQHELGKAGRFYR